MEFNRRHFLKLAGLSIATSAFPAWAKNSAGIFTRTRPSLLSENPKAIPILQGPTDAESTTIILLHSGALLLQITNPDGSEIPFHSKDEWKLPGSNQIITQLVIKNISPRKEYKLKLLNSSGDIYDQRSFSALDTSKKLSRFALLSCMKDKNESDLTEIWESLYQQQCDFVLINGDTCYSDNDNSEKNPSSYARRYAETRSRLGWFKAPRLVPTFATWDDHDAGENNTDKSLPIMPFTRILFRKFWGDSELNGWKKTFGVGSVFSGFGQRFILLDDRSFRDAPEAINPRHLGRDQSEWLITELNKQNIPTWLINGSQFFGGYRKKDGYEYHHPADFLDLLTKLRKASSPVVFASGDVHYSEIMEIEDSILDYKTYEFTSSSMHSTTFPFNDTRNGKNKPRRLNSEWRHNFMVLEVDRSINWNIKASVYKKDGRLSFSNAMSIMR